VDRDASTQRHGAVDPAFTGLLERVGARAFDESGDVICGIWPDGTLAYYNRAWTRTSCGGAGRSNPADLSLGQSVLGAWREGQRPFFMAAFQSTLEQNRVWEHTYRVAEGGAVTAVILRLLPLEGRGLILWHSLLSREGSREGSGDGVGEGSREGSREGLGEGLGAGSPQPLMAPPAARVALRYQTAHGFFVQCVHCLRVRAADGELERWDAVASLSQATPSPRSGAICPICLAYHYARYL
jgi:hypothetical protein